MPGVDLVDLELVGRGVGLLDDAGDPVVVADPDDAAVAGGVVDAGGEDRAGGAGVAVLGHEGGHGLGAQQRRVAREHEHVAVVLVVVVVGEAGEPDRDGVAGALLAVLLDELEAQAGAVLGELLGDPLGAVADHHDGPLELGRRQGVEHVEHHRPAAQQVQRLGSGGPHPGPLAGGEHHGGQAPVGHRAPVYPRERRGRTARRTSARIGAGAFALLGGRARTSNSRLQRPVFCQLNYPRRVPNVRRRPSGEPAAPLAWSASWVH